MTTGTDKYTERVSCLTQEEKKKKKLERENWKLSDIG